MSRVPRLRVATGDTGDRPAPVAQNGAFSACDTRSIDISEYTLGTLPFDGGVEVVERLWGGGRRV